MYQSTVPRINYDRAKELVYASGTVVDGYFGKRTQVGFAFDPASQKTIVVHDCGYFNLGLPDAIDQAESRWLLNNHPAMRDYVRVQS